jgi:hypothetical protein
MTAPARFVESCTTPGKGYRLRLRQTGSEDPPLLFWGNDGYSLEDTKAGRPSAWPAGTSRRSWRIGFPRSLFYLSQLQNLLDIGRGRSTVADRAFHSSIRKRTNHMETAINVKLPRAILQHLSAILQLPPDEALAFAVETYFGEADVENVEPVLLNRLYESEEQAVLGLNEYCARLSRRACPNQPSRVRAHWIRQMTASYRIRCTQEGWGVEPAPQAAAFE